MIKKRPVKNSNEINKNEYQSGTKTCNDIREAIGDPFGNVRSYIEDMKNSKDVEMIKLNYGSGVKYWFKISDVKKYCAKLVMGA